MKNSYITPLLLATLCLPFSVSATHESDAEISKRTAPIGKVYREGDKLPVAVTKAVVAAEAPAAPRSGVDIYTAKCSMCHATGAANAPKLEDAVAWKPRIAKGMDALLASAINGTSGGMPPKGMCMDCSDEELKATVKYMVESSQ